MLMKKLGILSLNRAKFGLFSSGFLDDLFESIFLLCVFIPTPEREGSTRFHKSSILSNRTKTSREGKCGHQSEEISEQITLG